jgi:hypothetical protein
MVCYEEKYGDIRETLKDLVRIKNSNDIYQNPNLTQADITRTNKLLGKGGC